MKETCEECGRFIDSSKINPSILDGRKLCPYCFKSENKRLNHTQDLPDIEPMDKSIGISKSFTRGAYLNDMRYLSREERQVMKSKYGENSFDKINQLNKQVAISKNKSKLDAAHETDVDLMPNFLSNLK